MNKDASLSNLNYINKALRFQKTLERLQINFPLPIPDIVFE